MVRSSREQRKFERLSLRVVVQFARGRELPAIRCLTENISADGFYCVSTVALLLGERREAELVLPALRSSSDTRLIKCQVRVVRVEPLPDSSLFGIGCQIETYALSANGIQDHLDSRALNWSEVRQGTTVED